MERVLLDQANLESVSKERGEEIVEQLFRYCSLAEFFSYFGQGESFVSKLQSSISTPDVLQIIEYSGIPLDEISKRLQKCGVPVESSWLAEMISEKEGALNIYQTVSIPPTTVGFAVNDPAENYPNEVLLEINIDGKQKVNELPGHQKVVLMQPTYVSTPEIKFSNISAGQVDQNGVLVVTGMGELLKNKNKL